MNKRQAQMCAKRFPSLVGPHWEVEIEEVDGMGVYYVKASKHNWRVFEYTPGKFDVYLTGFYREGITNIPAAMQAILRDYQTTITRMTDTRATALYNASPWNKPARSLHITKYLDENGELFGE